MRETREIEVTQLDSDEVADHLEHILSQLVGVSEVKADKDTRLVWTTFDNTLQSAQTIFERIRDEGYSIVLHPKSQTVDKRPGRRV